MCLAFCADALDAFNATILNGEDRFEVQGRTDEALCAADAPTTVQEFHCVHGKENTCIFM